MISLSWTGICVGGRGGIRTPDLRLSRHLRFLVTSPSFDITRSRSCDYSNSHIIEFLYSELDAYVHEDTYYNGTKTHSIILTWRRKEIDSDTTTCHKIQTIPARNWTGLDLDQETSRPLWKRRSPKIRTAFWIHERRIIGLRLVTGLDKPASLG